jgi:hypothetical protein
MRLGQLTIIIFVGASDSSALCSLFFVQQHTGVQLQIMRIVKGRNRVMLGRARICKRFRSPGMPDFVAWSASMSKRVVVQAARLHRLAESIPWNRFLGSLNVYKFGHVFCGIKKYLHHRSGTANGKPYRKTNRKKRFFDSWM